MIGKRTTVTFDSDLHRIIQKMRGYILSETNIELTFSEANNILLHLVFLQNGKHKKKQSNYFATVLQPYASPDIDILHRYMDRFFNEEFSRIIDEMIERDVPQLKK